MLGTDRISTADCKEPTDNHQQSCFPEIVKDSDTIGQEKVRGTKCPNAPAAHHQ